MAMDSPNRPMPPQMFHYTPLPPHAREIRLVRIFEDGGRKIRLQLRQDRLEDAPSFTAVSYRWGEPTRDTFIEINGAPLGITKSLFAFLHEARKRVSRIRMRQGGQTETFKSDWDSTSMALSRDASLVDAIASNLASGWLWIDAICINQDDLVERSRQVPLMKETYERATNLVIWLGEGHDETAVALDLLQRLADLRSPDQKWCEICNGTAPGQSFVFRIIGEEEETETDLEQLGAAGRLLNSGYWSRAWIRQEASTPKDDSRGQNALVLCGRYTVTRRDVFRACERFVEAAQKNRAREYIDLYELELGQIMRVKDLFDVRCDTNLQREQSLYKVLFGHRAAFATDPRDKVYANLGLMLDSQVAGLRLEVDYTLSVGTVFTNVGRLLIEESGSLDCLASAGLPRNSGVPSWAADWSYRFNVVPVPFYP
jgi:hypothetical protein